MMPWVKLPSRPWKLDPAIGQLNLAESEVFFRLFTIACREDPWVGYLVDELRQPLTLRGLAATTEIPLTSLHRHLPRLRDVGLVVPNIGPSLLVPHVVLTEQRFTRPETTSTKRTRSRAVENDGGKQLTLPSSEGASVPDSGVSVPGWNTHSSKYLEPDNYDVASSASPSVQELQQLLRVDDRVAYLLTRIAERSLAWSQWLSLPGEQQRVREYATVALPHLVAAIEQIYDKPERVRNPGAWLGQTIARMQGRPLAAEAAEVAS